MIYNRDQYVLNQGKEATFFGIIGILIALLVSIFLSLSYIAALISAAVAYYLFISAFWGINNLNLWTNKLRYKLPKFIWYILKLFSYPLGLIIGVVGYGFIEHFLLLIAIEHQYSKLNLLTAQIILFPYLGDKYLEHIRS